VKDFLVFIPCLGLPDYGKYSEEILVDYFEYHRINYFFLKIDDLDINYKKAHPSWLKLISHKYVDFKGFILCWDLDLLPVNKDITFLNDIDIDKINMGYDTSVILKMGKFNNNFRFNGGLIGIPEKERNFVENIYNKYAPGTRPSYEQYYLNDEIVNQNKDINILPTYMNSLYYPYSEIGNNLFVNAKFQHYTGGIGRQGNKINLIKNHYLNYFNLKIALERISQQEKNKVKIAQPKYVEVDKNVRIFKVRK
jgi:hypothetical protein